MKKNALDKFNNLPESSKIICNSVLGNHFNI